MHAFRVLFLQSLILYNFFLIDFLGEFNYIVQEPSNKRILKQQQMSSIS